MTAKVEDSTLAVVRAFERMGVPHYVTGSLASSLHGEPRATNDASCRHRHTGTAALKRTKASDMAAPMAPDPPAAHLTARTSQSRPRIVWEFVCLYSYFRGEGAGAG
jgi:hypothetical protein